jgi:nucleoside-diphosphate-sugar epimerase
MRSDFVGPVNIGSEEIVTINRLVEMVMEIAGKRLTIKHVPGPLGVRGRNSDDRLIREKLAWAPRMTLTEGLALTYPWIQQQVEKARSTVAPY